MPNPIAVALLIMMLFRAGVVWMSFIYCQVVLSLVVPNDINITSDNNVLRYAKSLEGPVVRHETLTTFDDLQQWQYLHFRQVRI